MPRRFTHRSSLPIPADTLFAWHERPGAFERLQPPWARVDILERHGTIRDADRLVMRVHLGPIGQRWVATHEAYVPGRQFCDRQVEGPFAHWVHTHRMVPDGATASILEDDIEYALPGGPIGELLAPLVEHQMLTPMFRWRHQRTLDDLRRHAAFAGRDPLRVVVSGASGLLGTALVPFLTTGGHRVDRLVRRAARPHDDEISWDPAARTIEAEALEGCDALVHLAGAGVADERWTPRRRREIERSRVDGTALLAETIARLRKPPRVWLSASAIGIYPDRAAEWVDESTPPGPDFLANVCRAWEAATAPATAAGVRVVHLRIGVVLATKGGALAKMLPPFRAGLGGVVGSGQQYVSWITLDDVIGAIHHLLFADGVRGPINLVAPEPATNAEFTHALGRALHRPTILPLPAAVIRLAFGEMGETLLLGGTRARSTGLAATGFSHLHPRLTDALDAVLGRLPAE